jgi:hypothetical protein
VSEPDASEAPEDAEQSLPLFPLSAVLFPGAPLPLQIFEERYRTLVRHLLDMEPEQRRFGVVAIQSGSEAGMPLPQMYPVGCVALVRRIESLPDGRSTLVAVGTQRFRLLEVDTTSKPYLIGRVRRQSEPAGEPGLAEALAPAAREALLRYVAILAELTGRRVEEQRLPDDPTELSYLTAGALLLPLRERQALLELADTASRLRAEIGLLRRERLLVTELSAVNAPELFRAPRSLN